MLVEVGLVALGLAALATLYAMGAAVASTRARDGGQLLESARNAAVLTFPLLTVASLIVIYLLVVGDFSVHYVWETSSHSMSPFLRVTALWGGQAGSLLFWCWVMSGFIAAALFRGWERDRELILWVIVVTTGTLLFFEVLVLFQSNPFVRFWENPVTGEVVQRLFAPSGAVLFTAFEGRGLNPLLRHFGMIGHPPTTYLGFTGFVIPYAFAMAALITRRGADDTWIKLTRRWTLVAWAFLGVGLFLGGRWAYDVLGWGGYWGWDPVENAMLMPWLTATAFLHSIMIQEKRGMLRVWNMILIILTYSLVIFGVFITRSGVVGSVHAFSTSAIGPLFFIFLATTLTGSIYLLWRAWPTLTSENEIESFLSRESAFLLQNALFLAVTFATLWGTIFPMISELVTGDKITVGPPYFDKVDGPILAALVLLMGIAPALAWRSDTVQRLARVLLLPFSGACVIVVTLFVLGISQPAALIGFWIVTFAGLCTLIEFWRGMRGRQKRHQENAVLALWNLVRRNRRRYGGYVIHLGIVILAAGIIGSKGFQQNAQANLANGETMRIGAYELRYEGLSRRAGSDGRDITSANMGLYRDGARVTTLSPRREYFENYEQTSTVAGVFNGPIEDVYVLLVGWEGSNATFKVYVNPLINWVWLGGVVMTLGTLFVAWPGASTQRRWTLKPAAGPRKAEG